MNLEQQVTSLEPSKLLEKLGVKQESYFKWNVEVEKGKESGAVQLFSEKDWDDYAEDNLPPDSVMYSAFTVAELGEMLPDIVRVGDDSMGEIVESRILTSSHQSGKWEVWYEGKDANDSPCDWYYQYAETEADARAKMLIYLLENGLITL